MPTTLDDLRRLYSTYKPRKPDPDLKRDLERGWMLPYLLRLDELTWQRWDYWYLLASQPDGEHALPAEPIPQIEWVINAGKGSPTWKAWTRAFDSVEHGWEGWSSRTYIEYVLDWILFGCGYGTELPAEPAAGASMRLYQAFDLWPLILWPHDTLGDIFAEMAYGRASGFYPTPHSLVELTTRMMMPETEDGRLLTVCDPGGSGTGRMLLHASNYSLNLAGQEINGLVIKASLVNGFLYAPWLVRPIQWCWDLAGAPKGATVDGELVAPGIQLSRRARRQVEKGQAVLI